MSGRTYCSVYGCPSSRRNKAISFFTLPFDEERRKRWIELIGREELLKKDIKHKSYVVCSLHFPMAMFKIKKYMTPDAMPTLLLPSSLPNDCDNDKLNKEVDPIKIEDTDKSTQTNSSFINNTINVSTKRTSSTQTEGLSVSEREKKLFEMLKQSEKKRRKLEQELEKLKKENSDDSEESEEDDDDEEDDLED